MISNFQRIIEKAKQEGEAKLKKIAPKFVVPEKVASEKLKSSRRSGGSSSSSSRRRAEEIARAKFLQNQKIEEERRRLERVKQEEIRKLEEIKRQITVSNLSRHRKLQLLRQAEENRKNIIFGSRVKAGEIQGFSSTSLSHSEMVKRDFLLKSGFKESNISTKEFIPFKNLNQLVTEIFLETTPTKNDKADVINYLRSEQFSTKMNASQPAINKLDKFINKMDKTLDILKKTPKKNIDKKNSLTSQLVLQKGNILEIFTKWIAPKVFNKRQVSLLSLKLTSDALKTGKTLWKIEKKIPYYILSGKAKVGFGGSVMLAPTMDKYTAKIVKVAWKNKSQLLPLSIVLAVGIKDDIVATGKLLIVEPGLGVAKIVEDYIIMKGVGKALKPIGTLTRDFSRLLNPKFKKLKNGKILIKKTPNEIFVVKGRERFLKSRVQKPSIRRPISSFADIIKKRKPGQFKKFQKTRGIELELGTIGKGETLKEQLKYINKWVLPVSVQADDFPVAFWKFLSSKRVVRKPIMNSDKLPKKFQALLAKFDKGSITRKEFSSLNRALPKYTGAKHFSLLERSTYFDPRGRVRFTRIAGGERDATLLDIFRGNFRFKGSKPQIWFMDDKTVSRIPKSLSKIKRKLENNIQLTKKEFDEFTRWQVTKKNHLLKPIGSTKYKGGIERELTITPGEIIRKVKKVGFTIIDGVKLTIYKTEIYKPNKTIKRLLDKAKKGIIKLKELELLERLLSKITNLKIKVRMPKIFRGKFVKKKITKKSKKVSKKKLVNKKSRRRSNRKPKPVLRIRSKLVSPTILRKTIRTKARAKPRVKPRTKARAKPRVKPRTKARAKPRVKPRTKARAKPRVKPRPMMKLQGFRKRTLTKKQPTYYVATRKRGKIVKLFPKPLTLKDARDYLAYSVDNNLTKTAWFVPLGKAKKVATPPKNISGYFSKVSKKLRPYKIKQGKKKELLNGYIEKRKFFQDTKGEKIQVKRAKLKRKLTPMQRRVLLARMKKARAARKKRK